MKKTISLVLCVLTLLISTVCSAEKPITVELDNTPVVFDQEPIIINERTMVPVRAIFEAMGADVIWDAKNRSVTSTLDGTSVLMVIDNPIMFVNGEMKVIDTAPTIVGDRTLVPVRAVSESFGCVVEWNGSERLVSIYTKDFQSRLDNAEVFSSVKKLSDSSKTANAAFSISYFPEYDVKTHTADGTDIEISQTTETGHIALNVRTDLYNGSEEALTREYTKTVAEGLVTVMSGTLISYDIVSIADQDYMKICYTAPGIVHGITDMTPEITIYMGRKGGVMYTMTLTVHGEVSSAVQSDFEQMLHSMFIA